MESQIRVNMARACSAHVEEHTHKIHLSPVEHKNPCLQPRVWAETDLDPSTSPGTVQSHHGVHAHCASDVGIEAEIDRHHGGDMRENGDVAVDGRLGLCCLFPNSDSSVSDISDGVLLLRPQRLLLPLGSRYGSKRGVHAFGDVAEAALQRRTAAHACV